LAWTCSLLHLCNDEEGVEIPVSFKRNSLVVDAQVFAMQEQGIQEYEAKVQAVYRPRIVVQITFNIHSQGPEWSLLECGDPCLLTRGKARHDPSDVVGAVSDLINLAEPIVPATDVDIPIFTVMHRNKGNEPDRYGVEFIEASLQQSSGSADPVASAFFGPDPVSEDEVIDLPDGIDLGAGVELPGVDVFDADGGDAVPAPGPVMLAGNSDEHVDVEGFEEHPLQEIGCALKEERESQWLNSQQMSNELSMNSPTCLSINGDLEFMTKKPADKDLLTILVVVDKSTGMCRAIPLPSKGDGSLVHGIRDLGTTLLAQLKSKSGAELRNDDDLVGWAFVNASMLHNVFAVHAGTAPYEQAPNMAYRGNFACFGEVVLFTLNQKPVRKGKPKFVKGVWWGKTLNNDLNVCGTALGIYMSGTIRRMAPDQRWSKHMIKEFSGKTYRFSPSTFGKVMIPGIKEMRKPEAIQVMSAPYPLPAPDKKAEPPGDEAGVNGAEGDGDQRSATELEANRGEKREAAPLPDAGGKSSKSPAVMVEGEELYVLDEPLDRDFPVDEEMNSYSEDDDVEDYGESWHGEVLQALMVSWSSWKLQAFDVKDAFPTVKQRSELYVLLDGVPFRVLRCLPGQQAASAWWSEQLTEDLEEAGLGCGVDVGESVKFLKKEFVITDLGVEIRVSGRYLEKIFGILDIKRPRARKTPCSMEITQLDYSEDCDGEMAAKYGGAIGGFLYSSPDRPDCQWTIAHLARAMSRPTVKMFKHAIHLAEYMMSTKDACQLFRWTYPRRSCLYDRVLSRSEARALRERLRCLAKEMLVRGCL
ncbi:unnamed protein product, partial [Symbiodinium sp. CCMP2592]